MESSSLRFVSLIYLEDFVRVLGLTLFSLAIIKSILESN